MESGEAQMSLSEVSLPGLIQTVLNGISMLDRKSIDIRMDCDPALPPVIIDRVKIERVLINLLDNAIKHTPQKGWIAVHAEVIGESIQVSVTDTGPGIPPEERARIFERFAQVTAERRKRRGFGLGLTYCRLAIAAHDGRIWVEPGENARGSRFIFTLPLNLMP
jgi:signal transduction histidine kinase